MLDYTGSWHSTFLPELPTMAEADVRGCTFDLWFGLLAPAETPNLEADCINNEMTNRRTMPTCRRAL